MSIKQHYETALKSIESEMERAIAIAKERVTRERIVPNNAEIDNSRAAAINAITTKLNQDIAKLQENFNAEKQAIVEASEKKKAEFAANTIATETSIVSAQYTAAMNELKNAISKIQE